MFNEKLQNGPVLFVGEGNFSFSLSIARSLPDDRCIIATSFEQEWQLGKEHRRNIEQLRRIPGVEVVFGVDGTCVHQHAEICHQQYKHIVFNFPHTGGKSKIQRNRNLLRDFFVSSSKILSENGDVLVNLCKGQGGTAADREVREWHNSWQVVAMAAEANLILHEVYPFYPKEFPEYTCIGFRSQDKAFHNEGALTHMFVKGQPLIVSSAVDLLQQFSDGRYCLKYFADKIKRPISKEAEHPLNISLQLLVAEFGKLSHILSVLEERLPIVMDSCLCNGDLKRQEMCCHVPVYHHKHLPEYCEVNKSDTNLVECGLPATEDSGIKPPVLCNKPDSHLKVIGTLRTSMVDCMLQLLKSSSLLCSDDLLIIYGPVYRNTPICLDCCPVGHEIVGCSFQPLEQLKSLLKHSLTNWLDCYNIIFTPSERNNGGTIVKYGIEAKQRSHVQFDTENGFCECVNSDSLNFEANKTATTQLGQLFLTAAEDVPVCSGFMLDALTLTKLKFNVRDWRILLSHNIRKHHCALHQTIHYSSECLHPPTFVHDISFWVNDGFTEAEFHHLVRSVCGDVVCDVKLLDEYIQPETLRISRCYRLVYQSLNHPLSYKLTLDMQLLIRRKIETELHLELR